jgi:hypothetical protein
MKGGFLIDETKQEDFIRQFGDPGRARLDAMRTGASPLIQHGDEISIKLYRSILIYILSKPGHIVELLPPTASLYGFIIRVTIPPVMPTFFKEYHWKKGTYEPIRVFLLKLSFLCPDSSTETDYVYDNPAVGAAKRKRMNRISEFQRECQTQYEIYNRSFDGGEYYVPPLLTNFIFTLKVKGARLNTFLLNEIINWVTINGAPFPDDYILGIFCMQLLDGYTTLKTVITPYIPLRPQMRPPGYVAPIPPLDIVDIQSLASAVILLLAYKSGVVHKDAHVGNIMVNKDYVGFLDGGKKGKVVIIDFGRIIKIDRTNASSFFTVMDDLFKNPTDAAAENAVNLLELLMNGRYIQDYYFLGRRPIPFKNILNTLISISNRQVEQETMGLPVSLSIQQMNQRLLTAATVGAPASAAATPAASAVATPATPAAATPATPAAATARRKFEVKITKHYAGSKRSCKRSKRKKRRGITKKKIYNN